MSVLVWVAPGAFDQGPAMRNARQEGGIAGPNFLVRSMVC
jgi:hypothetical protein